MIMNIAHLGLNVKVIGQGQNAVGVALSEGISGMECVTTCTWTVTVVVHGYSVQVVAYQRMCYNC